MKARTLVEEDDGDHLPQRCVQCSEAAPEDLQGPGRRLPRGGQPGLLHRGPAPALPDDQAAGQGQGGRTGMRHQARHQQERADDRDEGLRLPEDGVDLLPAQHRTGGAASPPCV